MHRFILTFLLAGFSLAAAAQQPPDPKTIAYWQSKTWGDYVISTGIKLDEHILERKAVCETGYGFDPVSFHIYQPLVFADDQPNPVSGVWTYRFKFNRCGETKIYNLLWKANPGKLPIPSVLPPGTTRASPILSADLMKGVATASVLAGVPRDCHSGAVLDTRVTEDPATVDINGKATPGVWGEQWDVRMCGREFKVDFCLVPTADGGTDWSTSKCPR